MQPRKFFGGRSLSTLAVIFGLMPVLPIFVLFLVFVAELVFQPAHAFTIVGDSQLIQSTINSGLVAFVASVLGTAIALAFVLTLDVSKIIAVLILCLLFLPGHLIAHGFDVFAASTMSYDVVSPVSEVLLVVALVGYVLPFQALILLLVIFGFRASERYATREFFPSWGVRMSYWLGRMKSNIIATFVIGFALAFTEYPRSHELGRDAFGFGGMYFGPLFVSRYYTQGIPDLYIFAASLLVAVALALVWRSWMQSAR